MSLLNASHDAVMKNFGENVDSSGTLTIIIPICATVGCLIGGFLPCKFSRRTTLIVLDIISIVGSLLCV